MTWVAIVCGALKLRELATGIFCQTETTQQNRGLFTLYKQTIIEAIQTQPPIITPPQLTTFILL